MELILDISRYVTALAGIVTVLLAVVRVLNRIEKRIRTLERHSHENYMNILKIIMSSENVPLTERLSAGSKYIDNGGNGAIKARYNLLLKEFEHQEQND